MNLLVLVVVINGYSFICCFNRDFGLWSLLFMSEQPINSQKSLDAHIANLRAQFDEHKYLRVTVKTGKIRTSTQNSALWLYFTLLAEAFNDAGLDMYTVLKEGVEIPWTKDLVHDHIWVEVQEKYLKKSSTTKLERKEVSEIFDIINRHIGTRFGLFVPFPEDKNKRQ